MRKLLFGAFFALGILLTSCSSDSDSSSNESFFNINPGSKWVYKRYNYDDDVPGVYAFSGITDSVEVLNTVTLNGLQFSHVRHKLTDENNPAWTNVLHDYLRINDLGQLTAVWGNPQSESLSIPADVTADLIIMHPGNVTNYQDAYEQAIGTNYFYTESVTPINVESNAYSVIPFFHKLVQPSPLPERKVEFAYEAQTGMIRGQCILVANGEGYQDRLVSYDLN